MARLEIQEAYERMGGRMSGQRELFHISNSDRNEIVVANHKWDTFKVSRLFSDKVVFKFGLDKYIASSIQDAVDFIRTASMLAGGLAGDPVLQLQNAVRDLRLPRVSI